MYVVATILKLVRQFYVPLIMSDFLVEKIKVELKGYF